MVPDGQEYVDVSQETHCESLLDVHCPRSRKLPAQLEVHGEHDGLLVVVQEPISVEPVAHAV